MLYLETPTYPTVKIVDIARLARAGHAVRASVVVDNTVATPINQNPLELGADLVMRRATKYLGGHTDAWAERPVAAARSSGGFFISCEIIGTDGRLPVVARNEDARAARREAEPERARHRALNATASGRRARKLSGAQISSASRGAGASDAWLWRYAQLQLSGGFEAIKLVLPRLRYAHRAANPGCVETVVGPPAATSHVECSAEERAAAGIPEGPIRYSTGIEDVSDLIADLEYALAVLG